MANYPLNPVPFLPPGFAVEPGPADRLVRSGMVVGPIAPLNHDFLAIAEASAYVPLHRRAAVRTAIEGLLHEAHLFTTECSDHPLGIGIFGFASSFLRDTAVNTPLELEEEDLLITFVPHNEALNRRTTSFGPEIWLMFFGFPYDYQTDYYITKALGGYGSLVNWYNPRQDRRYMLIKAHVIRLNLVPKSFIVWQLGGARDCWTVQVTILRSNDWNGLLPDVLPPNEEPPPADGNPHPQFGPELTAEQLYQMQLNNWMAQQGAGNNVAEDVGENAAGQADIEIHPQWGEWPASPPPAPPAHYNF